MVADHDEQHRQREIGIVHRALLADDAGLGVGRFAGAHLRDHPLLPRDDVEEHVGDHDRAHDRADVQVGRARAEQLEQAPGGKRDQHEDDPGEHPVAAAQQPAQRVVDEPAAGQHRDADRDAGADRKLHDLRVDQVGARAEPVDQREQSHARQPGRVGFPFRPVEFFGERFADRPDEVFLAVVEAAAVHRPELAGNAALGVLRALRLLQRTVEHDEVKRRANPRDAGDEMQPAQQQVDPVEQVSFHRSSANRRADAPPGASPGQFGILLTTPWR